MLKVGRLVDPEHVLNLQEILCKCMEQGHDILSVMNHLS